LRKVKRYSLDVFINPDDYDKERMTCPKKQNSQNSEKEKVAQKK